MNTISAERIFSIGSSTEFEELALEIFRFQSRHNPVYRRYLELMKTLPEKVLEITSIPFLPVEFFRTHTILSGNRKPEVVFESSGTTRVDKSKHFVADTSLYRESFARGFRLFYGNPEDYCILALLPSYIDRTDSSLVYMAEHLIRESGHPGSGFYLDDYAGLADRIKKLEIMGQKCLLLGVSFALLDLADQYPIPLEHTIVVETGGMKGRREEITRHELHTRLRDSFGLEQIHSEYGMTELLSQAWSKRDGIFHSPPWMKVLLRDPYDPMTVGYSGRSGGINIIDLANIHSCSFLATQDIGKITADRGFEVLGRFDLSELRGCNLMLE